MAPDLFVEQVPSSLAQFCVLTTFNTDIADPVKSLKVIINIGGQLAREIELPVAYLEAAHQVFVDAASKGEKQGMSFYRVQAGITPLTIENPAALEVFAIADGVEYPAGQLQIKLSSAA